MPHPRWHEPYMTPGEHLLWQGAPAETPPVFGKNDSKSLLFLPVFGVLAFMLYTIGNSGAPVWLLWSFGAAMGGLGLGVIFSALAPLLYRRWLTPSLAYAVTDRRILRYRRGVVDALDIANLPQGRILPTGNGCGTITFAAQKKPTVHATAGGFHMELETPQSWLSAMLRTTLATLDDFELFHIADAQQVLALIRSTEAVIPVPEPLADIPMLPLAPGEKLLWQGRPGKPPLFFDYDWSQLTPTFFVLGISAFMFLLRLHFPDFPLPIYFLFNTPLLLLAYWYIGRPLLDRYELKRTVIVITNRRILKAVGRRISSVPIGETDRMGLFQGHDGYGTVILGDVWATLARSPGHEIGALHEAKGFQLRYVPNAARVMDILNTLRKEASE